MGHGGGEEEVGHAASAAAPGPIQQSKSLGSTHREGKGPLRVPCRLQARLHLALLFLPAIQVSAPALPSQPSKLGSCWSSLSLSFLTDGPGTTPLTCSPAPGGRARWGRTTVEHSARSTRRQGCGTHAGIETPSSQNTHGKSTSSPSLSPLFLSFPLFLFKNPRWVLDHRLWKEHPL